MTEPEKMDGESLDAAAAKRAELRQLFPAAFTESVDENGELVASVDFERLKAELGEFTDLFERRRERYGMEWPGKADCLRVIQEPSRATLKPCRKESVGFDTTENLFIEGDNLEVLKLLQKSYHGQVKMIYIDPPYNTGKEFIYPDKYAETLDTYLEYAGLVDEKGRRIESKKNSRDEGRFHTKWLNMMYPRLYLARNLLRHDGVIFISIDDNEVSNLRKLCDEVFGEENFCAAFIWNTEGNTDNQYEVKVKHETILCYYKNVSFKNAAIANVIDPNTPDESNLRKGYADNNINKNNPANPPAIIELPKGFPCSEQELFYAKKEVDEDFFNTTRQEKFISDSVKDKYGIESKSGLPVKIDDMVVKDYKLAAPCRIYVGMANREKLEAFIENGMVAINDDGQPLEFYINSNAAVRYRRENDSPRNILSVLRNFGTTEKTKTYLKNIGIPYDYPKPVALIQYLLSIGCASGNDIVLDFFAGSATTAHAIMEMNRRDHVSNKFVLIQLPEQCEEGSEAKKSGFDVLSEISIRRIQKVIETMTSEQAEMAKAADGELSFEDEKEEAAPLDLGFRVLKLDKSNFKAWQPLPADASEEEIKQALQSHLFHVDETATQEDILFEILLKAGFMPSTEIETLKLAGKTVYSVAEEMLFICLEDEITRELIDAVVEKLPQQFICLDLGFKGNDQLKANTVQTFNALNESKDQDTKIIFRTV